MSDHNGTVVRRFVDEVIKNGNYSALRELVPIRSCADRRPWRLSLVPTEAGSLISMRPSTTWSCRETRL